MFKNVILYTVYTTFNIITSVFYTYSLLYPLSKIAKVKLGDAYENRL
jgi:hypothetical protein